MFDGQTIKSRRNATYIPVHYNNLTSSPREPHAVGVTAVDTRESVVMLLHARFMGTAPFATAEQRSCSSRSKAANSSFVNGPETSSVEAAGCDRKDGWLVEMVAIWVSVLFVRGTGGWFSVATLPAAAAAVKTAEFRTAFRWAADCRKHEQHSENVVG